MKWCLESILHRCSFPCPWSVSQTRKGRGLAGALLQLFVTGPFTDRCSFISTGEAAAEQGRGVSNETPPPQLQLGPSMALQLQQNYRNSFTFP